MIHTKYINWYIPRPTYVHSYSLINLQSIRFQILETPTAPMLMRPEAHAVEALLRCSAQVFESWGIAALAPALSISTLQSRFQPGSGALLLIFNLRWLCKL